MTKISKAVKETRSDERTGRVTNFMGGNSYNLGKLNTLKMITASSIFGEPQYYRDGEFAEKTIKDGTYGVDAIFAEYSIRELDPFKGMKTSDVMVKAINEALDEDFGAVLEWAATLRNAYNMRLNPQVIMVTAANHPKRAEWCEKHPGEFARIQSLVMSRADEPASQLAYQLYAHGGKRNCPNILKKTWATKLSGLSRYQVAKYKNEHIGMIDTVRVCHAHSEVLDELLRNGNVSVKEDEKTWENLRSEKKTWTEILNTIDLGHMALLRNLRNIFEEVKDDALTKAVLDQLVAGVEGGKQFPFRYYTAYKMLERAEINHKALVLDALERCMDVSLDNMPEIHGKVMCLSDNSGSAWKTFNSEYGSVTVAEIGNLSSVITAMRADEGYVGVFGDRLEIIPISKRNGVLSQMKEVTRKGQTVGGATENGIWLFWDKAITEKETWNDVFIYSDMQAGHGKLYGTDSGYLKYSKKGFSCRGNYIDVMKLVCAYRADVYAKVNVYSVQTAGYTNVLLPEYSYRANALYGWTGKEAIFADVMDKFWDRLDEMHAQTKNQQE